MFKGQAEQDKFVLNTLNYKRNGVFLEIGSNHPIHINNTYILEHDYDWTGFMVEYDAKWLPAYIEHRPRSKHIIQDATTVNYANVVTQHIDYLQIDLEVDNRSTLTVLEKLDKEVFPRYTSSTITFEHDIYRGNFFETRQKSRDIFAKHGYVCVFQDIHNEAPCYVYEDWYVHPTRVDMEYIHRLQKLNRDNYEPNSITGSSLDWRKIQYP
jgi:hypothetical protein